MKGKKSVDVHHIAGRTGRLLNQFAFWVPVSRQGHDWIHNHMDSARGMFWEVRSGPVLAIHRLPLMVPHGYWLDPSRWLTTMEVGGTDPEFCSCCGWVLEGGCRCFLLQQLFPVHKEIPMKGVVAS